MKRIPAALFLALCLFVTCPLTAQDRPNIILIMSDDMGYSDIGCYGGEIQTPVLDGLADGGLRFTQFYNTGRCCPTRASLMTGLYPHQAGVGHMLGDKGLPGYTTGLNRDCLTIAEAMRLAGYRTYMTGKWHVTKETRPSGDHEKFNWPLQRGFDRFFGTIHGAGSFYDPNSLTRDNELIPPDSPELLLHRRHQPERGRSSFATMRRTMTTSRSSCTSPSRPPTGPCTPGPHNIKKYDGVYDCGWDAIRDARYKRVKELGLIDPSWEMTPRDVKSPAWEDATDKEWEIALMEVYAAMVDCMDQNIGRIVGALKDTDQFDNTLIFFLQDNGGCAEGMGRGNKITYKADPDKIEPMQPGELQYDMIPKRTRDGKPLRQGRGVIAGPADTLPRLRAVVGQCLEHALSRIQALGPRGRHLHAAHRPLAQGHRRRSSRQTRNTAGPPDRHHGHLRRPWRCRLSHSIQRRIDHAAGRRQPPAGLPGQGPRPHEAHLLGARRQLCTPRRQMEDCPQGQHGQWREHALGTLRHGSRPHRASRPVR